MGTARRGYVRCARRVRLFSTRLMIAATAGPRSPRVPAGPLDGRLCAATGFRDGHAGAPSARSSDFWRLSKIWGTKALLHR